MDDAFWSAHRPGDRWGCQCSLEATDDPATDVPKDVFEVPDPGLDNNPADDGKLFSDSHPYFPDSCATCPFNTGGHKSGTPTNKADRECCTCSKIAGVIGRQTVSDMLAALKESKGARGAQVHKL